MKSPKKKRKEEEGRIWKQKQGRPVPERVQVRDRELRKKDAPPHVVPTQRRAPTAGRLEQQQRHADPWACCLLSDGEGLLPRGHQS